MRRLRVLALAGVLTTGPAAVAQLVLPAATLAPPRTRALKADLLPLLAGGLHLSLEQAWGSRYQHSLSLTPQLYHAAVSTRTSTLSEGADDRVRGAGLGVQYRRYLALPSRTLAGLYVAAGPQVQFFRLAFRALSWAPELAPDGLVYYQARPRPQQVRLTRLGGSVVLGRQVFVRGTRAFVDAWAGLGWRTVRTTHATVGPADRYAAGMSDYGHHGFYLPVGLRLGWAL